MKKGILKYYIHSEQSFEDLKESFEDERTTVEEESFDKDQTSVVVSVTLPYNEGEEEQAIDKYCEETAETLEVFSFYDENEEVILTEEDL